MVFNWFRRQFGSEEKKPEKQAEPATEQVQAEPSSADASEEPPAEEGEDYLSWAKAAYKNIQKQQTGEEEKTEIEESVEEAPIAQAAETPIEEATAETREETSPGAEVAEAPVAEEAQTEAVTEAAAEQVEAAPTVEPTPTEAIAPETAETAAVENATEETPVEVEPETAPPPAPAEPVSEEVSATESAPETETAAAPTSFLARAQAERQARLDRLSESAIETPTEEPAAQGAGTVAPGTGGATISGLTFDEGFLWSAEVLASQGRRPDEISIEEITWLQKLRQGLDKTRRSLINQLRAIVGQGPLNKEAVMEIEAALLQADVGIEATDAIIDALQQKLKEEALPPAEAIAYLKQILRDMLDRPYANNYKPIFVPEKDRLNVWLIAGVNGAGKTTTIGKIAHIAKKSGYSTLIAAADTFRAAAVEQVKVWGQRSNVEVIANPVKNADPAAVVFDAVSAAQARGTELLLVDTAGRLQNKKNLMDELAKVRRIIDKKAPDAVVESLLVLDATLGQNGMRQAQVFSEAINLNGVILTKLDGTAKGGIALAIVQQMGLPIRFIGAGEGIEDLRPFSSYEFVEALISG
ncbi:signal recognition particle-docking protein FtsY [Phormidium sp. CCY1219]|uniref:signal recognition particle-docking protein FtsY n=1 Tax=Phormidium sp. CCY1219 TaxID=2886104 RepID=UPI002D1E7306|nr:signal recognition particle-docking protein FtsY [Phormidium sp. CCY1219]MEB3826853.1 signal recognition particle-docking protein FtsY [Phormidium sp. CCY1219]